MIFGKKHLPYCFDVDIRGFKLSENFLFGVCNSPFHVEGYFNMEGYPFNQWGRRELEGAVERSGIANDFWNSWQPHIDKSKELGLNAFRMGFSWARIQPSFSPDKGPAPAFDFSSFDRYAEIVASIYAAGMEPVITIYHFVQPAWVGSNLWIDDSLVERFMTYAETTLREVNTRLVDKGYPAIWFWVTFNEPAIASTGPYLRTSSLNGLDKTDVENLALSQDNIMTCHMKLYDLIHDLYEAAGWREPHVGFNIASNSLYEYDKGTYDLCRARELQIDKAELEGYFSSQRLAFYDTFNRIADRRLEPISFQRLYYENQKHEAIEVFSPLKFSRAIETLYASKRVSKMDYVAVNIYDPFIYGTLYEKDPEAEITIASPAHRPPWWEWSHERKAYEEYIELYAAETRGLPFYILEASVGHKQEKFGKPEPRPDGLTRLQFLKESLAEIMRGIQKGYPIMGYLYWTLADNYEWGTYTTRLGLLEYDYETNTIKDTDGFGDPTGDTYKTLIEVMRSGDEDRIRKAFENL